MLEIGEQDALLVEAVEQVPGFAEPVVGVPPLAGVPVVGAFLGEVSVRLPPGIEVLLPRDGRVDVVDVGQCPAELQQPSAGIGAGVAGEVASGAQLDVEDAPLYPGGGPVSAECGVQSGAAVADGDSWGGDSFQERGPGGVGFGGAPLPGEHVAEALGSGGGGDEQAPGAEVDAVEEDVVVAGFHGPEAGHYLPAPGGGAAEGAGAGAGQLGLGVFAGEPVKEPVELVSAGEVGASASAGSPAAGAAPALSTGAGGPVFHESGCA